MVAQLRRFNPRHFGFSFYIELAIYLFLAIWGLTITIAVIDMWLSL